MDRPKIQKKPSLTLVILVGILITLLAYYLRLQQFFSFPPVNDTRDEYKYAFNGISLIKNKVPESWSWYEDYKNFEIKDIRGSNYRMVRPYFEDPPLFALIMGSYAISKGMDGYEKVDAGALRWPMLKLGALNVFLLFALVYFIEGFWEASLAGLIYATVPTLVLSSRLPLAENFLVTLLLISLLLLVYFLKNSSFLVLNLIGLLAGSSVLVKQTGIFIPGAIFLLLLAFKKKKAAIFIVGWTLAFLIVWLAYGYYYGWPLFVRIQILASGREIRLPSMIINLFETFRITEKMMSADGWIILGWVSLICYSFRRNFQKSGRLFFIIPISSYLVFFTVMSGHLKGWYRIPFYPFLSWAVASFFLEILNSPRILPSFFFITLGGFASLIAGTGEAYWSNLQVKIYQVIFLILMAPFGLWETTKIGIFKKISQAFALIVFLLMIYYNIRTILLFQDQFWY